MSDFLEPVMDAEAANREVCRVAYTLDNAQPVLCSIIGDQPLFYMDYEDDILSEEDDDFFDFASAGFMEHEIQVLREEIRRFERACSYEDSTAAQRSEEFLENIEGIESVVRGGMSDFDMRARKDEIIRILGQSRLAATYLDFADSHHVEIMLGRQVEKAFYDRRSGMIQINADLDLCEQVLLLARELRRHWQHRQGVLINPLMFQPEHAVLVARAQDADLAVSMIRTAWELQLAGRHDIWERVETSPMGDLARAFAREAFMDFRTINNGEAAAAIFEAWFLSERCRRQDKDIIQTMLADYKGYVFENIHASKSVTAELISGLGRMPYGKNYLAIHATTIMTDPVFTEVRDRSSANFLWFIKFERSFRETERELQSDSDLSTHDIRHDLLNTQSRDSTYDHRQAAQIIHLYTEQRRKPFHGRSGGSAQIIDFRRWSGR